MMLDYILIGLGVLAVGAAGFIYRTLYLARKDIDAICAAWMRDVDQIQAQERKGNQ